MGDLTFGVGSLLDEQIFGYWGGDSGWKILLTIYPPLLH